MNSTSSHVLQSVGSGLAGAIALNLIHEAVRRVVPDAPHIHVLGEQSIAKLMKTIGLEPPANEQELYPQALVGDVLANTIYYSLIGTAKKDNSWWIGTALGLAAGLGAVALPGPMSLNEEPTNRKPATKAMTVGWYVLGGLAATAVYRLLEDWPLPVREGDK